MNEIDYQEILDILRTAYLEEDWEKVEEVINLIVKYDSTLDINSTEESFN